MRAPQLGCVLVLLAATLSQAQDTPSGSSFVPLSITTTALPPGLLGTAYTAALAATGGTPPYSNWQIVAGTGALNGGLSLDSTTGVISGTTPLIGGTPTFTVQVQDSSSPPRTAFARLNITQYEVGTPLFVATPNIPAGAVNTAYSATLEAAGGAPSYNNWTVSSGTLPAGLSLDPALGTISGTPTAKGASSFTIQVKDSAGTPATATAAFSITINAAQVPLSVTIGPSGTQSPAQQPQVAVTLSDPTPLPIWGALTLTFASAVGGDDQLVRFSNGTRTAPFFIPTGDTPRATFGFQSFQSANVAVLTGTVAGTITITAALSANGTDVTPIPAPSTTINIIRAAPVITKVMLNIDAAGGMFTVSASGYSTTRDMTIAMFHFHPVSGTRLAQMDLSVDVGSVFTTWYSSTASTAYGSEFTMVVPFTFGGPLPITTLTVDLTNSFGTSARAGP